MQLPVLYSFRRCPYAIRARLALYDACVPFELREVSLRDKPADMLALSPKGTVPVLHLPDGRVLEQSLDIMLWALAQHDPHGWLTAAPLTDMLALIEINDEHFKPLLDRYKYPERYPERPRESYGLQATACQLEPLNARLQKHPYLFGAQACLADMAILPFVRQFAQVAPHRWGNNQLVALQGWLHTLTSNGLFEAVMAKHSPHIASSSNSIN